MKFPTLYKLSSKGKIQEWDIKVLDDRVPPVYGHTTSERPAKHQIIIEHGQQNGKKQSTTIIVDKGKNIGKKNETTPWQQAVSEAQSKWNKQLDKGYRENINELKEAKAYLPMLAKSYDKDGHKIKFPCIAQMKLDGIRCLAYLKDGEVVLQSRRGKFFKSLPHIAEHLKPVFNRFPDLVLDGELYKHGDNFQKLISAIKRDEPSEYSPEIEYHIYDLFWTNLANIPYSKRKEMIDVVFEVLNEVYEYEHPMSKVDSVSIPDSDYVAVAHKACVDAGYEGAILRNLDGTYEQDRRSENLQKVKSFIEEEFEIIGAEECIGKFEGFCTFTLKTDMGATFSCMPNGTDEQRRQIYQDWLSGKIKVGDRMTVGFFEWTSTLPPVPRFPQGKAIRNYE